jgi:S1-C subfamily serine protease
MDREMDCNRLKYLRYSCLPQLTEAKALEYYSDIYSKWERCGSLEGLKNVKLSDTLGEVVSDAMAEAIGCYKKVKQTATSSITRNLGVKLLYWLDSTMSEVLKDWNERSSIKIVADNVVKEQEYIYYLFLTFIGCDVFLMETRADADVSRELLGYSQEFTLGGFGTSQITPYSKHTDEQAPTISKVTVSKSSVAKPADSKPTVSRASVLKPTATKPTASNPTVSNPTVSKPTISKPADMKTEKSFEELAQLASSIVMIGVHDYSGEVVSSGSGIMIGRNGFILTNCHVVSGGKFYSVRVEDDDREYSTNELIKYNSDIDLAVIRIDRQLNAIPLYNGEKKLVRGQKVVAIGSPLGLFNSVSDGIISGFRKINDIDMIQFTAPISHGSSGGAVLNMQGELIGISTAGIDSGQNLNLAVGYENIRMFTNGFRG